MHRNETVGRNPVRNDHMPVQVPRGCSACLMGSPPKRSETTP